MRCHRVPSVTPELTRLTAVSKKEVLPVVLLQAEDRSSLAVSTDEGRAARLRMAQRGQGTGRIFSMGRELTACKVL